MKHNRNAWRRGVTHSISGPSLASVAFKDRPTHADIAAAAGRLYVCLAFFTRSSSTRTHGAICCEAYYTAISMVDHAIGGVLKTLEESGQLDRTCIIFTADHGEIARR